VTWRTADNPRPVHPAQDPTVQEFLLGSVAEVASKDGTMPLFLCHGRGEERS
jgi:hypothetical protein